MRTYGLYWKSQKQQKAELEEQKKTRDVKKYGQDGHIQVAEKQFRYKGIPYLIKVLRYYTFTEGFKPMGSRRKTQFHAVVEYPDEVKKLVELIVQVQDYYDFLWHDTLHSWNDKQTLQQQIDECHRRAKENIKALDKEIPELIKKQSRQLRLLKFKIKREVEKIRGRK